MLDAQRTERNYFLLHDPADLRATQQTVENLQKMVRTFHGMQPQEAIAITKMQADLAAYQQGMRNAARRIGEAGQPRINRLRGAVLSYEEGLNKILRGAHRHSRASLVRELHDRTSKFDSEIAAAGTEDPVLQSLSSGLEEAASSFLRQSTALEHRSWNRVEADHDDARALMTRAEWVLGSVSLLVLLISIWVSYILPREVVQPLHDLKAAVDHAAAGDYEIEFDVQGKGEVVQLANSVRDLIAHVREKESDSTIPPS
jgi:methyl-accepting chemotaxis protein